MSLHLLMFKALSSMKRNLRKLKHIIRLATHEKTHLQTASLILKYYL